jgi:hypothetical protein
MLMVAAFIMIGTSGRSTQGSDAPVGQSSPLLNGHTASSIDGILSSRPWRTSTFSPFIPWKSRSKIVLEETNQKIVDECDLGPAIPPLGLLTSVPVELALCHVLTRPPLRC